VIWDVPLGKQADGWAKEVLGGWQVTGIFNARTGTPFTIYDSSNALGSSPRLVANGPLSVHVTADPPRPISLITLTLPANLSARSSIRCAAVQTLVRIRRT